MRSKNGDGGTGVHMREGTTSRVTAADRTYRKFYDFYSASPENFGSTHVYMVVPCDPLDINNGLFIGIVTNMGRGEWGIVSFSFEV